VDVFFFHAGNFSVNGVGMLVFTDVDTDRLCRLRRAFERHRPHKKSAQQFIEGIVKGIKAGYYLP